MVPACMSDVYRYVGPPDGSGHGGREYELTRERARRGHDCMMIASNADHLSSVPQLHQRVLIDERDGFLTVWLRTCKAPSARPLLHILSWLHFEWPLFRLDVQASVQEFRHSAAMIQAERSEMGERGRTWILEHNNQWLTNEYLPIVHPSQRPILG